MRRLYIADPSRITEQTAEAERLGCAEVSSGIPPRYIGLVKELPAIVLEDGDVVVAVLNRAQFSEEDIAMVESSWKEEKRRRAGPERKEAG
jgi:hypothetical protein